MKDTLQIYDELMSGGCTESQARAQAQQMGEVTLFLANQEAKMSLFEKNITSIISEIRVELSEIKKDLYWMRVISGAMIIAFIGNIIFVKM